LDAIGAPEVPWSPDGRPHRRVWGPADVRARARLAAQV